MLATSSSSYTQNILTTEVHKFRIKVFKMLLYACFLSVILSVRCASAPFIKPCKAGDIACTLSSAQAAVPYMAAGVPELGIKPLDPMYLAKVQGNQGGLSLTFTDTTITGMKGCTVEAIKHDLNKGKQSIAIKCSVELNGNYNLNGQILVLPIQGDGTYTINIHDIIIKAYSEVVTTTGADGQPHWHVKSWRHTYQVLTGAEFQFNNLFNGNKVLGEPVEKFLNTNWRDVMQEIAPPVVSAIVSNVVDAVEALYKAVPADQLYIQ